MAEGYFLTVQQEQIYNEIRTKLSDATTKFIALTGSAGTGKTLLTYHIAKESIRKGENGAYICLNMLRIRQILT